MIISKYFGPFIDVKVERGICGKKKCCALIIGISRSGLPKGDARELDKALGGTLSQLIDGVDAGPEVGKVHVMFAKHLPIEPERIVLVGIGKRRSGPGAIEDLRLGFAAAAEAAERRGLKEMAALFPKGGSTGSARAMTEGFLLGAYKWDRFKRRKRKGATNFTLLVSNARDEGTAEKGAWLASVVSGSVWMARDLANTPSNELDPTDLANLAQALAGEHELSCRILGAKEIEKAKMTGLMAVSGGSAKEPRFIEIVHNGTRSKGTKPIVIVGKAITFDSGGISLKGAANMDQMKYDMSGGAIVLGLMRAVARLKLPLRVIGLVPSAENLPSGRAYKPGDVLRYKNGSTVEIISTDAEGRLILADGLLWASELDPRYVVDIATLTGGVKVALAKVAAAVLGNEDNLVDGLIRAGQATHERLWRMPQWPEFNELIKGETADIKNSGGREGSTCTASAFLSNFVSYPWAHIDIAGMGWVGDTKGYVKKGATAFGVRLLVEWLRSLRSR